MMKKLSSTDEATRSITPNADKNTIVCIHTVKPEKDSPVRYELNWTFDFSDVTASEMLALAGRTVLITQQAAWRKLPTDKERLNEETVDNVTYRVRDMLDQKRSAADPKTKVIRAAEKMSKAERAEMIAALEAMDAKD